MAAISCSIFSHCSIFTYRLITEVHPKPGMYHAKLFVLKVVRPVRMYMTQSELPGHIASDYH